MDGKNPDCNQLLGKIISPLSFLRQINIMSLNKKQVERILRGYGLNPSMLTEMKVCQIIVITCKEPITAISKDGENSYRYILKPS